MRSNGSNIRVENVDAHKKNDTETENSAKKYCEIIVGKNEDKIGRESKLR